MSRLPHKITLQFARRFLLAASLATSASLVPLAHFAVAQDATTGADVENAKNRYLGAISGNQATVRSGPTDTDYPTIRLDKGAEVVVVGIKNGWLKIVPPAGSFSYVTKLYINKHGDGTTGTVAKDGLPVFAGGTQSEMKATKQCTLNHGEEVTILGEAEEYYRIKPPADAYVWIHQNLVAPVKQLSVANTTPPPAVPEITHKDPVLPGPIGSATTKPSTLPSDVATIPQTQPSVDFAAAAIEFDKAEDAFKAVESVKLEEQNVSELQSAYEKLIAADALPASMRRVAEARVSALKVREASKVQLLASRKTEEETSARLLAIRAERTELEERVKELGVQIFTAVGTLQTSSLQTGNQILYRLTDPASGRTVCYARSNENKIANMIGQFVGVRGAIAADPQLSLKVVTITEIQGVEQAKVNKTVSAQIIPPSLLGKGTDQATSELPTP